MNIAVIVRGGIGDLLQATPLLRTLRSGAGDAHITLLCPRAAESLVAGIPGADEVAPLHALDGRRPLAPLGAVWFALRRRRLDAVLVCGRGASCRLAAFLAAVPVRIGPAGGVTGLLLSSRTRVPEHENAAATALRLAEALGLTAQIHAPSFDPGPDAVREAERLLEAVHVADGVLRVAIAPGTALSEPPNGAPREATAWDPERYALLANTLAQRHGAEVIFLGIPSDQPVLEQTMVHVGVGSCDLSDVDDLRVIGAVLARCDLLVSGDSPLLHLAAAVGTAAVGLFGPTDGRARGPYGGDHRVIQAQPQPWEGEPRSPAMHQIRVDDVLAGVEAAL